MDTLLVKLIVAQLAKKIPALYRIQMSVTAMQDQRLNTILNQTTSVQVLTLFFYDPLH
jgi:hypothetical protein